ncbi:MAG: hypothetical protein AABX07_04960 [Nanoarchaeota archaeon]
MGFLKKSSPDIDFTLLQKRGIIRKPKEVKDVLDLTAKQAVGQLEAQVSQTQTAASPFSFLDTAGGAASFFNNNGSSVNSSAVSAEKLAEIDNVKNSGINSGACSEFLNTSKIENFLSLKVQIDNLEFKLERLLEKFDGVSLKLAEFERKIT